MRFLSVLSQGVNDDLLSVNSNLERILAETKLSQAIDKPMRVTSLSATLLDIVISNKYKTILHSDVVPCPIADHDLITAKYCKRTEAQA